MKKLTIEDQIVPVSLDFTDVISGSSFTGISLKLDVNEIVQTIGLPSQIGSGDNKVQLEWVFWNYKEDGKVLTIYDYKEYRPIYEINDWHIGSKNMTPIEVKQALLEVGFKEENIIEE